MPGYSLFIDDERMPPRSIIHHWIIARDMEAVQLTLWREGMPSYVSFDHDLGNDSPSGYDIAKYLCELDMAPDNELNFPADFDFYVHSQNPIGAENIRMYLTNYLAHKSTQIT